MPTGFKWVCLWAGAAITRHPMSTAGCAGVPGVHSAATAAPGPSATASLRAAILSDLRNARVQACLEPGRAGWLMWSLTMEGTGHLEPQGLLHWSALLPIVLYRARPSHSIYLAVLVLATQLQELTCPTEIPLRIAIMLE